MYQSPYEAVLITREALEASVELKESRPIVNSGKIYVKDNLLIINEKNEGFHIYDNSNPEHPVALNFLKTPGATDIAIRNNMLYINQAVDLIAVMVTPNAETITVTKRIRNTFPEMLAPDGSYAYDKAEDEVVVNWIETLN
ncbi:hypothetical protein GCM10009117_12490 [Gangjinia marincola]|uniref:Uncharacterized protein n=2 Tax=Gangjinia marincola TaxID=578463 RepID=A0ABN1MG39_9FLAO